MTQSTVIRHLRLAGVICLGLHGVAAAEDSDVGQVRALLIRTFDKPEAPLGVAPIVVVHDAAIAGWTQGGMGGRALLRKKDSGWSITLCAGDALKDPANLVKAGVARSDAELLAQRVVADEASLPQDMRLRFSAFDGIVAVDGDGNHRPSDPHHQPIR